MASDHFSLNLIKTNVENISRNTKRESARLTRRKLTAKFTLPFQRCSSSPDEASEPGKPLRSKTDMFSLMPPRHIPTLPISPIHAFDANVRFRAEAIIDRTADMGGLQ